MVYVHVIASVGCWECVAHGMGSSSAISRSKRRNKIATKKNRKENGSRAVPRGSNPHSYGESFSVSGVVCGSQKLIVIKRTVITVVNINIEDIFIILPQACY